MPSLADFQHRFARALMSEEQPAPPLRAHAFTVYRNTSARGAIEALRATYATVNQLLGEDGFSQVAFEYRQETPAAIQRMLTVQPELALNAQLWEATRRFGEMYEEMYVRWLEETIQMVENQLPETR